MILTNEDLKAIEEILDKNCRLSRKKPLFTGIQAGFQT